MKIILFRKVFLYVIAAVYFCEAVMALVAPETAAELVGYQFQSADGFSEFRAVYLGMWSVLCGWSILAARRAHEPLLGDVVASLVFAESLARILSLVLDGTPGSITYLHIAMEFSPLAILLLRPPSGADAIRSGVAAAALPSAISSSSAR